MKKFSEQKKGMTQERGQQKKKREEGKREEKERREEEKKKKRKTGEGGSSLTRIKLMVLLGWVLFHQLRIRKNRHGFIGRLRCRGAENLFWRGTS